MLNVPLLRPTPYDIYLFIFCLCICLLRYNEINLSRNNSTWRPYRVERNIPEIKLVVASATHANRCGQKKWFVKTCLREHQLWIMFYKNKSLPVIRGLYNFISLKSQIKQWELFVLGINYYLAARVFMFQNKKLF